ncbi:MAG: hypothetical protein IJ391_09370 [Clostridia bacterium]|nr:hypothetical protein [Clostridia bacterium]
MTDLHTHVLHGIDDGSPDIETSVKMLKTMYAQGVRTAVATPHFDYTCVSPEDFISERDTKAGELAKAAEMIGIKLLCGCELRLNSRMLHLDSIKSFCIGNTRNILVEMPFTRSWDQTVYDNLASLIDYYNVKPIIAHVERYHPIIKSNKIAEALIELGAYLQLDASSLFEKPYQRTAKKLLKSNLITVVASDTHNTDKRPPDVLCTAFDEIGRLFGRDMVLELISNADELVN